MKTKHSVTAFLASADPDKVKADVPSLLTMQNQELKKGNRDGGRSSFQTIDMSEPVPAALVCSLVAE